MWKAWIMHGYFFPIAIATTKKPAIKSTLVMSFAFGGGFGCGLASAFGIVIVLCGVTVAFAFAAGELAQSPPHEPSAQQKPPLASPLQLKPFASAQYHDPSALSL
jgi:hypothetical protein